MQGSHLQSTAFSRELDAELAISACVFLGSRGASRGTGVRVGHTGQYDRLILSFRYVYMTDSVPQGAGGLIYFCCNRMHVKMITDDWASHVGVLD